MCAHTRKKTKKKKKAPEVRLELTTYRLTAGRAADCAIQDPCAGEGAVKEQKHARTQKRGGKMLHAGVEPATFGS